MTKEEVDKLPKFHKSNTFRCPDGKWGLYVETGWKSKKRKSRETKKRKRRGTKKRKRRGTKNKRGRKY